MSSTAYSAEITPEPALRRCVCWSGAILGIVACLVILSLPAALWLRLAACGLWVAMTSRELWRLQLAWTTCRRLRFTADGAVEILEANGTWYPACLDGGSVLLRRAGWIRLRNRHGARFGELLRGHARRGADWRRLQVIWRHVGASDGSC